MDFFPHDNVTELFLRFLCERNINIAYFVFSIKHFMVNNNIYELYCNPSTFRRVTAPTDRQTNYIHFYLICANFYAKICNANLKNILNSIILSLHFFNLKSTNLEKSEKKKSINNMPFTYFYLSKAKKLKIINRLI